jgi:polyhydroxyalkanoate synthesis repressor PhaR
MQRLIKRYESRKLYDTEESRYVSLEEMAEWIRGGHEVKVVDNATGTDVTAQMLTQIILDEGRKGTAFLPSELLHELVRAGQKAVESGVEQVQHRMDRFLQSSIDRLAPVRKAREEMDRLRERLEQLEGSLTNLEESRATGRRPAAKANTGTRRERRKKGESK